MLRRIWLALLLVINVTLPESAEVKVDLELILMADASGSIEEDEFLLQRLGYARALRDPRVINAIRYGPVGRIALAYVEWSGPSLQIPIVPWTMIQSEADIARFAKRLEEIPRVLYFGGTAPGDAILYAIQSLQGNSFTGRRLVIDVSGDDVTRDGLPAFKGRDRAVAEGITVNGLPILQGLPGLEIYYRDNVIGGPGSFYVAAKGFRDFGIAVRKKLIREIAGGDGDGGGRLLTAGRR